MNSVILKGKLANFESYGKLSNNWFCLNLISKSPYVDATGKLQLLYQQHQVIVRNCPQLAEIIFKAPLGTTVEIKGHLESNLQIDRNLKKSQAIVVCDPQFGYEIWINDGEYYFANLPKLVEEFEQQQAEKLTPLEIECIITQVAHQLYCLDGKLKNIPFIKEDINCIFTYKRNWGDGLWFYLEDGCLFDFNFDCVNDDISLYERELTGDLYEQDQHLFFWHKAIQNSLNRQVSI